MIEAAAALFVCTQCGAGFRRSGPRSSTTKAPRCRACRAVCVICGDPVYARTTDRCEQHRGIHVNEVQHARVNHFTRYADDPEAQRIIDEWPSGAPLEVVAEAMGVSVTMISNIEQKAMRKLEEALRAAGIAGSDDL